MFKTLNADQLTDSVAVLIGTRPGIIKMAPLAHRLMEREHPWLLLHAGQHYSYELDGAIMEDLGLPKPDFHVRDVQEHPTHGQQTATMLKGLEDALIESRPRWLLVCGDANTNLAGALAARKLNIGLAHVEAGLRSRDWSMPEEHNRVMIDHISDLLFAPTALCKSNLETESVRGGIHVVGNTVVDAFAHSSDAAKERSTVLADLGIDPSSKYAIVTFHREENVDIPERLANLVEIAHSSSEILDHIVLPLHPRTRKNLHPQDLSGLEANPKILLVEPLRRLDFVALLEAAAIVLTDSGGIQEEACIAGVSCLTLRDNTERPESVDAGANEIVGTDPSNVLASIERRIETNPTWVNPYGDGTTSSKIIDIVLSQGTE